MYNRNHGNRNLLQHLSEFVGETVTIFTTSGGPSGCGFTGVLLSVNPCFVRLMNHQGSAPENPFGDNICNFDDDRRRKRNRNDDGSDVGSVCDIPIDRIASFCHNTI